MAKYGRLKRAFFEDGMIMETARVSHLKRCVRERRVIEGYFGRVWFRPTNAWQSLREAERARYWEEAELADSHSCYANADAFHGVIMIFLMKMEICILLPVIP